MPHCELWSQCLGTRGHGGDTGTLSQMDTCHLLPLPKPYWTQLNRRLRSRQTPNPVLPWDLGTRAFVLLPAATPATPKSEHHILGGAGRDLCLLPCGDSYLHCHPVSVCAFCNPFRGCQLDLSLASYLVHLVFSSWPPLSFLGLPVFRPHFYCPPSPGDPQCGGSGLWCVHVCIYVFVTPWGLSPVFC